MSSTANAEALLVQAFDPVGLAALNAKAAMLERLDRKYVVRAAVLRAALPQLARRFDVLEIDGRRAFLYETCYFDDPQRRCYFDHQRGRRRRLKVRVRRYADAALCFVEVKLKDRRGSTVKKRLPYDPASYGRLDERALAHVERAYRELYGIDFRRPLAPTLCMTYRRITLVAKQGGERVTVDFDLRFDGEGAACSVDREICIVETKSANGNGVADGVLRQWHQHPTRNCSKYCVGMSITGAVQQYNRFLPALRRLGVLGAVQGGIDRR
jgi:hypothetical protein